MQEIVSYKIIKFPFKEHKKYKAKLLKHFKQEPLDKRNNYNMDNIYKCDFHKSTDPKRPWAEMILPDFLKSFEPMGHYRFAFELVYLFFLILYQ